MYSKGGSEEVVVQATVLMVKPSRRNFEAVCRCFPALSINQCKTLICNYSLGLHAGQLVVCLFTSLQSQLKKTLDRHTSSRKLPQHNTPPPPPPPKKNKHIMLTNKCTTLPFLLILKECQKLRHPLRIWILLWWQQIC